MDLSLFRSFLRKAAFFYFSNCSFKRSVPFEFVLKRHFCEFFFFCANLLSISVNSNMENFHSSQIYCQLSTKTDLNKNHKFDSRHNYYLTTPQLQLFMPDDNYPQIKFRIQKRNPKLPEPIK